MSPLISIKSEAQMKPSEWNCDELETRRSSDCEAMTPQVPRRSPRLAAKVEIMKNKDAAVSVEWKRSCTEKDGERFGKKSLKKARPLETKVFSSAEKEQMGHAWQQMVPADILASISDLLSFPDLIRFRSSCHSWFSAPSSRSNITKFAKYNPYLILHGFENDRDDDYTLLQLPSSFRCTLKLPALRGAVVLLSKSGWLLCHRRNHYFFYDPFTLEKIDLPEHHQPLKPTTRQVAIFTAPPTSEECITFVIRSHDSSELEFNWWRPSYNKWSFDLIKLGAEHPSLERSPPVIYYSCASSTVSIWQSKSWMEYDMKEKELDSGFFHSKPHSLASLEDINFEDSLSSFVEKDVILQFSSFSRRSGCCWAQTHRAYRVMTDIMSAREAVSVEAIWIEPTFPWK